MYKPVPIYPCDCIVIAEAPDAQNSDQKLLYCWGYSRVENLDSTRLLCESSPGPLSAPSYSLIQLEYLGYRDNPSKLLTYFGTHFKLTHLDERRLAFVTDDAPEGLGVHTLVSERWQDSRWYFIRPRAFENIPSSVRRGNVWASWQPAAHIRKGII